ncbi:MAG: purine-binding chemotaxis protein CheW [Lentisphaerae bacterium]|nr:MAG: purine-binding chemotaxis protein CheW [Lentisphaerota bacterium]
MNHQFAKTMEEEEAEDTMANRYLAFSIENQDYAFEIYHVLEIIQIQNITPVPDVPDYVKGVINLRGQVIPVVDMRMRFGLPSRDYDDRTCIIVVRVENISLGLIVDRVQEVFEIAEENISPPPRIGGNSEDRFIHGIARFDDEVKLLLNLNYLLFSGDFSTQVKEVLQSQAHA